MIHNLTVPFDLPRAQRRTTGPESLNAEIVNRSEDLSAPTADGNSTLARQGALETACRLTLAEMDRITFPRSLAATLQRQTGMLDRPHGHRCQLSRALLDAWHDEQANNNTLRTGGRAEIARPVRNCVRPIEGQNDKGARNRSYRVPKKRS